MFSKARALAAALLVAAAGCYAPVRSGPTPEAGGPSATQPAIPALEIAPSGAEAPIPAGHGRIQLRVKWPEREVQRIPASANSLIIAIYDPLGVAISTTKLARPTGPGRDLITDVSITIVSARHLTIWARAYRELSDQILVTSVPVAVGTATGEVRDNAVLKVSLNLTYIPITWASVNPVSPTNGGAGAVVTFRGVGFNGFVDPNNATPSFALRFARQTVLEGNIPNFPVSASQSAGTDLWIDGTSPTRVSDLLATASVPVGAITGPVDYMVDGLSAVPPALSVIPTFHVLKALTLTPAVPSGLSALPTSLLTGSVQFTAHATDSLGLPYVSPSVTWSSSNTRTGVVSSAGLFTPLQVGTTTVAVRTGNLVASQPVLVSASWSTASYQVVYPVTKFATVSGTIALPNLSQGALTGIASN